MLGCLLGREVAPLELNACALGKLAQRCREINAIHFFYKAKDIAALAAAKMAGAGGVDASRQVGRPEDPFREVRRQSRHAPEASPMDDGMAATGLAAAAIFTFVISWNDANYYTYDIATATVTHTRAVGSATDDSDQRLINANDGYFKHAAYAGEKQLYWGGPIPKSAAQAVSPPFGNFGS